MDWLFSNWTNIMDWLSQETVENSLAILAGWIVFCFCLVTLWFPFSLLVRFVPTTRTVVISAIVTFSVLMFAVSTFEVHHWLNLYQSWYTTPLNPPLETSS